MSNHAEYAELPDEVASLWSAAVGGQRRALALTLTEVEQGGATAGALVALAGMEPRRAHVIGITGAPGVGKSTLTSALITELRKRGRTVAVLAIDPSSPFTGGAVLGDRIRMQEHLKDDGVFIRSAAARGQLGGLSPGTRSSVVLLEGVGFNVVLLETVGVGQSEVSLIGTADTAVVAISPGSGDAVQAEKAGIMEIADIFVVNKADQNGAGQMVSTIKSSLEMASGRRGALGTWSVPVVRTVAVRSEGIEELVETLEAHDAAMVDSGELDRRRVIRAAQLIEHLEIEVLRLRTVRGDQRDARALLLGQLAVKVVVREIDSLSAAHTLIQSEQ